jgi:hypothetical protein
MQWDTPCDKRFNAYKNLGSSRRDVNIAVNEHCHGTSSVILKDSRGHVVSENIFAFPGGAIT